MEVSEYPFAPYLFRPNNDQFTRITRLGYVLLHELTFCGTIRNYYISFTWITYVRTRWIRTYYASLIQIKALHVSE